MSNKKITIASIVLVVLAVLLGIAFTLGHKTTAENLQAQEWDLTNNNHVQTATFLKSNQLHVKEGNQKVVYKYKIIESNKKDFIKITGNGSMGEPIKYTYKIDKKDNGYYLQLIKNKTNHNALNDLDDFVGNITLAPKND